MNQINLLQGAVTARIVLGQTTRLAFINSHLAAGAEKGSVDRRNWDAAQIISRTKFEPITDAMDLDQSTGEQIGDEDFAFWFGDLNYRLEGIPGDDVRRLLMLHTKNQYDIAQAAKIQRELEQEKASNVIGEAHASHHQHIEPGIDEPAEDDSSGEVDPASLQATISSLMTHDELHQQIRTRKAFHDGWKEGPIQFLPTYKYDVGSVGIFDSSDKRRGPSWCDRILYRTRAARQAYLQKVQEEESAKKRDEEMKAKGLEEAADDESVLFDYNPEEDGDEYDETADAQPEVVTTKEGFEDEITQEYYTAHQRVLSSDHKPLDAVFLFKYDAVIPDIKSKITAEVARELDRAENEGRPTVTLVVDPPHRLSGESDSPDESGNQGVNFGRLHFGDHKTKHVTIANTGQVPATIGFVNRPGPTGDPEPPMPVWLTATFDREPDARDKAKSKARDPATYTLEPGDACNVKLTARVEAMELVKRLNDGSYKLDDVLILRVNGGKDDFLPVSGRWVMSGLDKSIEKLMKIPEAGIRKLQNQNPDGSGSSSGSGWAGRWTGHSD
jgi:phosphatidylinositol-bisphosphatase